MRAALARGAAAAAKVKAKPTVETYNSIFPTAARDISMQLVLAKDLNGFLADPDVLIKALRPFANQEGKAPATLPQDATPPQVIKNLVDFAKELKRAQQFVDTQGLY